MSANDNNQNTAGIIMNYQDVFDKAEEMGNLANKMELLADQIIQEWDSLNPWNGVVASEYKQKVIRFSSRLQQEARGLKFTADVLRSIATTLKQADEAAKRVAEQRLIK